MSQSNTSSSFIEIGKVTSVFGVKGWLKIYSHTDPITNILNYPEWTLKLKGQQLSVRVDRGQRQGKGLIAHFVGCDDREQAHKYCGAEILVPKTVLPELDEGEFYWHQLEGLNVVTGISDNSVEPLLLGKVDHLLSTGSNDVLVVKPCEGSIDQRERLIPYLEKQVVCGIDLTQGVLRIDWDPEF
ncbi:ribosome maturation factor RimM [Zooshikella sp. RANM57]|uniref:ribosome maturation factor RimM n=1 Tax=Zooshikella sp. RANM57 TaxID=3425863 RepID=UPI003D6F2AAD